MALDINAVMEVMGSLYKKDPTELLATLKSENGEWSDDAADKLKEAISGKYQEVVDNQSKRFVRQRMEKVEKHLNSYGNFEGETLEEKLDAFHKSLQKDPQTVEKIVEKEVELTPEALVKHPLFIEQVKTRVAGAEKAAEDAKDKYNQQLADIQKKQIRAKLKATVMEVFDAKKVVLPEDEEARKKRINFFLDNRSFEADRFAIDEEGNLFPVNDKGERLQDGQFNNIGISDYIMDRNPYGIHNQDPNKTTLHTQTKKGDPINVDPNNKYAALVAKFSDYDAMEDYFETTPMKVEDKVAIREAYAAAQPAG